MNEAKEDTSSLNILEVTSAGGEGACNNGEAQHNGCPSLCLLLYYQKQ